MNKKCLSCPAALLCVTNEAWMCVNHDIPRAEVYIWGKTTKTGITNNLGDHVCIAPPGCPNVIRTSNGMYIANSMAETYAKQMRQLMDGR